MNSTELTGEPQERELEQIELDLNGREHGPRLFEKLLEMLRIPICTRKLNCFSRSQTDPYRAAFLICWRQLDIEDRREVRHEMLWWLFLDTKSDGLEQKKLFYREADTDFFPDFSEWCEQQASRSNHELFIEVVETSEDTLDQPLLEAFSAVWSRLAAEHQLALKALWLRFLRCACHSVENLNGTYFFTMTRTGTPEPI